MDGQQRINAVLDFYAGRYALKGLERWTELNGVRHDDLPDVLKRGLDRRRLSATVVVVDSSKPRPAHGPLQRWLEILSNTCILRPPEDLPDTLRAKYQPNADDNFGYGV